MDCAKHAISSFLSTCDGDTVAIYYATPAIIKKYSLTDNRFHLKSEEFERLELLKSVVLKSWHCN